MKQIPDHAPQFVSVENQFPEDLYDAMREFVRRNRTIVINLCALPEAAGQRLVDYACGGMAAIDGQSHQLGLGVFLFTSGVTRVEAA